MSNIHQIGQDLQFVRAAVDRSHHAAKGPAAIYILWAIYVLIGYTLIDFAPAASGWFFLAGGIVGGIASWLIGRRWGIRTGEWDRDMGRRAMLHWAGGIGLAIGVSLALAATNPALRGNAGGQLIVAMIGLVYFLAGVHFDRNFLWLGPLLVGGAVGVGFIPRYGWTGLGAVIAVGLIITAVLASRTSKTAAKAD